MKRLARPVFVACLLSCLQAQQRPNHELPDDPFAVLAAMGARPAEPRGVEVRVVAADGTPVPDAIVLVLDADAPDYGTLRVAAEQRHPGDEPRILAARASRGTRYRVDGTGRTRVPSDLVGRIVAVHGELLASVIRERSLEAAERRRPVELRLLPPVEFQVVVSDVDGLPAANERVLIRSAPAAHPFPVAATRDDGKVTFRLIAGRPDTAIAELAIGAKAPIRASLPTTAGAEVKLRIPPSGSIKVNLVGDVLPGTLPEWQLLDGSGTAVATPTTTQGNTASFARVEAGFGGQVSCKLGSSETLTAAVQQVTAGAVHELEVRRDANQRCVVMRLLQLDGTPAKDAFLLLQWQHEIGSSSTWGSATGEGWVEAMVPAEAKKACRLRIIARADGWNGTLLGWVELEIGTPAERRDVRGDLRLQAPAVALQGMVVDPGGNPVRGIDLYSYADNSYNPATVADDGSFELRIHGQVPGEITLAIQSSDWFFAEEPSINPSFPAGTKNARVVVQRAARMRFAARGLPAGLSSDFSFHLESTVEGIRPVDFLPDLDGKELRFPPGTWNVVIRCIDREVHRIDDVRGDAGIENHDPRFMDFDWQAFATLVSVRVEDRHGAPTNACTIWRRYRGASCGSPPTNGVLHLLMPKDGYSVSIEREDEKIRIELGQISGEHVVRLGCGPLLTVALDKAPTLPEGAVLVLQAGKGTEAVAFDAEHRARIWLPETGEHVLKLGLRRGTETAMLPWQQTVEAGASGNHATIRVTPELQRLLDVAGR